MLIFVVILSSCVTTASHLYTVRKQVCEFDGHFSVQYDRRIVVGMKEPVLSERDVVLLIGAPPTDRIETAEGLVARYVFVQSMSGSQIKGSLADETFGIELEFVPKGDKYLLAGIKTSEIPEEFHTSVLLATTDISEFAEQACDIRFNLLSRSTELEVDRDMLEMLPERESVISWLGPPLESGETVNDLGYEFRLVGEGSDLPVVRIGADYDRAGVSPTVINVSFTRYHASVDVPAGTVRVTLN